MYFVVVGLLLPVLWGVGVRRICLLVRTGGWMIRVLERRRYGAPASAEGNRYSLFSFVFMALPTLAFWAAIGLKGGFIHSVPPPVHAFHMYCAVG